MCLRPESVPPVPAMTARVARVAFPKGNLYMRMRDEMGPVFADEAFAPLFPSRGQPAIAPWRLALVTIMQYAEGLSDEQAADAVRARIDWKYTLSLDLTDAGFDSSVLCEFRTRLVQGKAETLLFTTLLEHFRQRKLLAAHGRQRTDSTHVLAAIRTLNRLEEAGETLRHALNALAVVAPDWLRATSPAEWLDRYSQRFSEDRLPKGAAERETLARTIGRDGFTLLEAVFADAAAPWLRQVPAVEALRRIWIQHFYRDEAGIHWRSDDQLPPAPIYGSSPYDPDARYACKRTTEWVGYKVHLTETCEPDAPHLITHVATTPAPLPDHTATAPIHQALRESDLLPTTHLVDGGYVQGALLATTRETFGVDLFGPAPPESCWQAREPGAFAPSKFRVDWEARTVTCPEGKTSLSWSAATDRHGKEVIQVKFSRIDCRSCPSRSLCTRNPEGRRTVTLRPKERDEAVREGRRRQETEEFASTYAQRAGVEGTISQGVRRFDLRRCRYVGHLKAHLQHLLAAAALNFVRVAAWLEDPTFATTRTSAFARLMLEPVPA